MSYWNWETISAILCGAGIDLVQRGLELDLEWQFDSYEKESMIRRF